MPITKPGTLPRWGEVAGSQDVVGPNELAPNSGQQDTGFLPASEPPAQWFNFLFRIIYDWIQWLNDLTNQALTWAAVQTFAAGIVANVTGNVTGSSGSCTGNAATATNAGHATTADSAAACTGNSATATTAANGYQWAARFTAGVGVIYFAASGPLATAINPNAPSRTAQGTYTLAVPGLTANAVILATALNFGSPGAMVTVTPAAGSMTIKTIDGANGANDGIAFSLVIFSL